MAEWAAVEQIHQATGVVTLNRRQWLRVFGGLCGILSFPFACSESGLSPRASVEDWISQITTDVRDDVVILGRVGKTYLTAHPLEAGQERLSRLLVPEGWDGSTLAGMKVCVQRDWINHNVTVIEGWVLARTEARLCGLIFQMGAVAA